MSVKNCDMMDSNDYISLFIPEPITAVKPLWTMLTADELIAGRNKTNVPDAVREMYDCFYQHTISEYYWQSTGSWTTGGDIVSVERFLWTSIFIYGSIIDDPEISTENPRFIELLNTIISQYTWVFEKYPVFSQWVDLYTSIGLGECDIDNDFIEKTNRVSKLFSHNAEDHILSYWDFVILLVGIFPKELFGSIEVNRLTNMKYKTILESLSNVESKQKLIYVLLSQNIQWEIKDLLDMNFSPSEWCSDVSQFISVCMLLLLNKSEQFKDISNPMFLSLF